MGAGSVPGKAEEDLFPIFSDLFYSFAPPCFSSLSTSPVPVGRGREVGGQQA